MPLGAWLKRIAAGAYREGQRRRASRIVDQFEAFVQGERRFLSVGDGDGSISAEARRRCGLRVRGLDVEVDLPLRDLSVRLDLYDGARMPYPDASFDVVAAVFALHHCDDVEQVLSEMVRVARRKVVVVEDVYRNRLELALVRGMDRLENRLVSSTMNIPLNFRSAEAWERAFAARGLRVERSRRFRILTLLPVRHQAFWLVKTHDGAGGPGRGEKRRPPKRAPSRNEGQ